MAGEVFKEAYEIIGEGLPIAEAFFAEREAAEKAQWEIVEAFGAKGYRPGHGGNMRSLFFETLPENFRRIGREGGLIECVPHKGRTGGKDAAAKLASGPIVTPSHKLADKFGWQGRSPFDGRLIYYATATKIELPSVRYLLRLPRLIDDGFVPPEALRLMPMSEFMRAFEDHNTAAKALREAE